MVSAGISAAQTKLDALTSSIHISDKTFDASTGGVVPIGWAGLPGFANITFASLTGTTYPSYNYSLLQQGLTANVTCQSLPRSPISRSIVEKNLASPTQMQAAICISNISPSMIKLADRL